MDATSLSSVGSASAGMASTTAVISFWPAISELLGWLYFAAWTVSFWPQALLIHRRRSVEGVSLDFLALNELGFVCYSIYNVAFLVSGVIQEQYKSTHGGHEHLVRWNDAFFALHALLLASYQLGASFFYKRAPGQRIHPYCRIAIGLASAILLVALVSCIISGGTPQTSVFTWLSFVNLCSYVKLIVTLVKYSPQIALNFARKSTLGFAIEGVLLDLIGGLLSLLQLIIDSQLINHDWTDVTGNPGKLGLSLISMTFDLILITQHYCLYGTRAVEGESNTGAGDPSVPSPTDDDPERRPLLSQNGFAH